MDDVNIARVFEDEEMIGYWFELVHGCRDIAMRRVVPSKTSDSLLSLSLDLRHIEILPADGIMMRGICHGGCENGHFVDALGIVEEDVGDADTES